MERWDDVFTLGGSKANPFPVQDLHIFPNGQNMTCASVSFAVNILPFFILFSPPADGGGDQQAAVGSPEGHHGVQRRLRGGRLQTCRRGAGYHDQAAGHRGEAHGGGHRSGNQDTRRSRRFLRRAGSNSPLSCRPHRLQEHGSVRIRQRETQSAETSWRIFSPSCAYNHCNRSWMQHCDRQCSCTHFPRFLLPVYRTGLHSSSLSGWSPHPWWWTGWCSS